MTRVPSTPHDTPSWKTVVYHLNECVGNSNAYREPFGKWLDFPLVANPSGIIPGTIVVPMNERAKEAGQTLFGAILATSQPRPEVPDINNPNLGIGIAKSDNRVLRPTSGLRIVTVPIVEHIPKQIGIWNWEHGRRARGAGKIAPGHKSTLILPKHTYESAEFPDSARFATIDLIKAISDEITRLRHAGPDGKKIPQLSVFTPPQ